MTLGNQISSKRKEQRLTQEVLAKKIGVSAAYISQIENGLRNPSYSLFIKLSSALDVPINYFWDPVESSLREPSTQLIHTAVNFLTMEQKAKVIEYLCQLTGSIRFGEFPVLNDPASYAEYLLKHIKYDTLPVDPFEVAKRLSIPVVYSSTPMPHEGMLVKSVPEPIIILDSTIEHVHRHKFTLALMIGHLIIPWHMRSMFTRDKGKRSLDQEGPLEIEAQEFAGELMIPSKAISREIAENEVTLEAIEQLAYTKYECSMTAFIHKFNTRHNKITAFLTSKKGIPTRIFNMGCKYTIADRAGEGSLIQSFIVNPPSEKEYKKGYVDAVAWIKDPPPNLKVYEESVLDPQYGVAITLLKFSS